MADEYTRRSSSLDDRSSALLDSSDDDDDDDDDDSDEDVSIYYTRIFGAYGFIMFALRVWVGFGASP